ncbi:MAG: heparinase II/III domain-containing protein, partial [Kiloniellales bacterium]
DGSSWLSMTHDGYLEPFGLLHRRRLYLAAAGDDLRGEDRLTPERHVVEPRAFVLRFHLHPSVRASLVENGAAILLRLPKGDGWRFQTRGATLALDDSLYLGAAGAARRSNQIVLSGESSSAGAEVKWALRRVSGRVETRGR